jgi:hypothetical protein
VASDRQIEANRANALLSTGPTSPEGKAKCSQNALKTGLDAKSEVIRLETLADYEELTANFYRLHAPADENECFLVDRLISCVWLHRRYLATDTAVWERGFHTSNSRSLGLVFGNCSQSLARVDQRLNSAQRNFDKTMAQLRLHRANRAADPPPATGPENSDAANEPLNPELGLFLNFCEFSQPEPAFPAPRAENSAEPVPDQRNADLNE